MFANKALITNCFIIQVPGRCLTVGVGTVMDADEVMILVTGTSKALALHKAIEEGVNHMWTVSAFQVILTKNVNFYEFMKYYASTFVRIFDFLNGYKLNYMHFNKIVLVTKLDFNVLF